MILYTPKQLNTGFVIICHENNVGYLKNTVASIKKNYSGSPYIAVASNMHPNELKEMQKVVPQTYVGGKSYTSLINLGMKNTSAEWVFLVLSGSWVRANLDLKFSYFIDSEKDILFPIANGQTNFIDGTINGIFMNKKTFKKVGDFGQEESLEECKTYWATKAIESGCVFKAVQGAKIC